MHPELRAPDPAYSPIVTQTCQVRAIVKLDARAHSDTGTVGAPWMPSHSLQTGGLTFHARSGRI